MEEHGAVSPLPRDLVGDPVAAITAIYEAAGMDPPPGPTGFVDAYDRANPRHAHGTHRYSPADFGLDADELRERFADLVPGDL